MHVDKGKRVGSTDPAYDSLGLVINIIIWAGFALLVFKMVRAMLPLRVNAEATGFEGLRKQNWQVTRVTGRVLGANSTTETQFSAGYQSDGTPFARARTDVRETFRLYLLDGRQNDFQAINFHVNPRQDDVITICYAQRGSRWNVIAVLNHTTNQQFTDNASLFKLLEPHAATYAMLGSLVIAFIGVFTACFLLIPGFGLMFLYYKRKGNVVRNFGRPGPNSGIAPLWVQSAPEAAALTWHR
ncbi:hypothetical protein ACFXHA_11025 [Nocardia sp. NPDC059240]|uniref:hypothetical protein n=1 Tax=Nocardia sp. NPDC059240 TaxID=3346786 RepID=UPI0036B4B71E